jgi:hypothetical protein
VLLQAVQAAHLQVGRVDTLGVALLQSTNRAKKEPEMIVEVDDTETLQEYHLRMVSEWESLSWRFYNSHRVWSRAGVTLCDWLVKYHKKKDKAAQHPFSLG